MGLGLIYELEFFVQIKFVGWVLYYLLIIGVGFQILGEEYCDILQVSSL